MFCLREGKPAIWDLYSLFHFLQDICAVVFHDCRSAVIKKRYGPERTLVEKNNKDICRVSYFFFGDIYWAGNQIRGGSVLSFGLHRKTIHESNFGSFLVFVCLYRISDRAAFFKSHCQDDNGSALHLPDPFVCFIYGGDSVSGISFRAGQRENVWRTQSRMAIHQYRILAAAGILSGKCI